MGRKSIIRPKNRKRSSGSARVHLRIEQLEDRVVPAPVNLSTGLDTSNNLIAVGGTLDANWYVDEATGGPAPAQVTTPSNPVWNTGAWLANGPNSDWVTRNAGNINQGFAPPDYTYYRFFTLSAADLSTAAIVGGFAVDDAGVVALNGHSLGTAEAAQSNQLTPFSVPAGSPDFVVGLNELTVTLTQADNNIEGVRLDGTLFGTAGETLPPAGPTLYWDAGHAASGTASGGSGTWNPADNNWFSGSAEEPWVTDNAAFSGAAGTVTVAGPISANSLTFNTDGYNVTGGSLTLLNYGDIAVNTGTTTIGSVLAGTTGLTKTGPGTLVLSGTNTYTGSTVIDGGALTIGATGGDTGSAAFIVNPGADLILPTSGALGSTAALTLDGGALESYGGPGSNTLGALNLGTGLSYYVTDPGGNGQTGLTVSSLAATSGATFNINGPGLGNNGFPSSHINVTSTPSGLIGGGAAPGNNSVNESILPYVVYDGANTVDGTYYGWVSYQNGQLSPLVDGNNQVFQYNQNINNGTVSQDNVNLNNSQAVNAATTINSLILNGNGGDISGAGAITISSGALMYQRDAAMANPIIFPNGVAGYLYVSGASTTPTVASAFSGNSGLTITGENSTSPITLTGQSTYTGTTYVNNALVVSSAPSNFGNSNSLVLDANGILAPTGSNFLSGGQSLTFNPGSSLSAAGLGTSVNNLTFNAGSLGVSLDYNTQLKVSGAVQLNGATLNLVLPSAPVAGTQYTLIANSGGQAIGGTFASLPEGATVLGQFGGKTYTFQITYQGGSGHDVVLTATGLQHPAIGSLTVAPNPVTIGNSIALTANNVTDGGGTVTSVSFYRESNGTAGLQTGAGGDTLIATVNGSGPYTTSASTTGLATGTYTFYALATDNLGDVSTVASTTEQVNPVPTQLPDTMDLSTGLDSNNNLITVGGTPDAYWTVDQPGGGTAPAQVTTPSNPVWYTGTPWVANGPNSDWITIDANQVHQGYAPPTYSYYRYFTLTAADLKTATIVGAYTQDDIGYVSLNGNQLASSGVDQWTHLTPFWVPTGSPDFKVGLNVLTITMTFADDYIEGVRLDGTLYGINEGATSPPAIGSLTAAPNPVTVGTSIALTANNVTDTSGTVTSVSFYRESNGTPGLQTGAGGDTLIATVNGSGPYTTSASTTGLAAGTYTFYAQATDSLGDVSNVASATDQVNALANQPPVIGSLSAMPNPVTVGTSISLTANNVTDASGTVTSVSFYRESNGTAGLQTGAGGDTLIASVNGSGPYTTSASTTGLTPGTYTFYAQATDNLGDVSNVASATDQVNAVVNQPPAIGSLTAAPSPVTVGTSITLTANNVIDAGGTVTSVSFYRESNGTAGLQTGVGGDTLIATVSGSGPYTTSASTTGLAAGTYTFYAQATDNLNDVSNAASATDQVNAVVNAGSMLYWDPAQSDSGTGSGGSGTWNSSNNNWFNGSVDTTWVPGSTAVFAGSAGIVTLGAPISANGLTFSTDGYTVTGNPLTLVNGNNIAVNTGTATIGSAVTGSAGLTKIGTGTLVLTAANNYTGATVVNGGTLSFGTSGSDPDSSSFTVSPGADLIIQAYGGGISNRLGSTAAVTLSSGALEYFIGGSGNTSESIGALNLGTGLSYYVTDPGVNSVTSLTVSSLVPTSGATFNINASALGNNGNPSSRFVITNAPAGLIGGGAAPGNFSANESILPYVVYDGGNTLNGTYAGWVSYQNGQLTALIDGTNQVFQYNQNINSGTVSQDNVNLNNSQTVNAATTINSLILNANGGDISGNGAITISSGALMYQRDATMANPIVFPNGIPGYLYVSGAATNPTIASAFSGNSGLTITGENSSSPITLSGASTYTGTTYINNALVVASTSSNFGNSTSIVLDDNGVLASTANNFLSGGQSLTLNPGSSLSAAGLSTSVNNLTFNAGSLGTSLDYNTTLKVGGTVELNGATLNLVLPSAPAAGTPYTLISNQGGQAVSGTFAGLSEGATVSAQFGGKTYSFTISYQGGSGHDVVLTASGNGVQAPVIGSLTAAPNPVTVGTSITLTANNVTDVSGTVTSVSFYRESNGTPGLQTGAGGDTLIATLNGSGPYTTSASTTGLAAGTYAFYAQATDNLGDLSNVASATVQVNAVVNQPPAIGSLSATPSPVAVGTSVTLTANNVTDASGTVTSVSFYRESNGTAGLQTGAGGDTLIATVNGSGPYTTSASTTGLAAGTYTFYAQATDNLGNVSNVASATDQVNAAVNQPPMIGSLTAAPSPVTVGTSITLTANNVTDASGTVTSVSFYRESNGTAGLQTGAGGDTLIATVTGSGPYTTSASTTGLAAGTYTFYAQATDNLNDVSNVPSTTDQVNGVVNQPTTINLSTGLDANNNLITVGGTLDAHWTVDELTGAPAPAQVTTPSDPVWYTGTPWLNNGNGIPGDGLSSDWITRDAFNENQGPAPYTYYRTFVLSAADLATATISGGFTGDDTVVLALNGHPLGSTSIDNWGHLTPFSVPAGSPDFVVGLNQLTITMTFADDYIEGVRLEGTLSGIAGGETLPPPGPALDWDPAHISSGTGSGGSGIWNFVDNNWYSASANAESLWVQNTNPIFGGPAGTVQVAGPINTTGLTFNADGYNLTGGSLTLLNGNDIAVNTGTTTIGSILDGTEGLTKTGPGTLVLTAAEGYTGPTTIANGTLDLTGADALTNSFIVDPGTYLVDQSSGALGSSTALTLNAGALEYLIGPSANTSESTGALNLGTGLSYYETNPGANSVTSLTVSSLTPSSGATFNINASALGGNSFPAAHIAITSAPSGLIGGGATPGNFSVNESILPYVVYDGDTTVNGNYGGWVSYQYGQLVPLTDGANQVFQYNQNINSGTVSQDNVNLNNSQAVNAATTINSLILNANGGDISGNGAITISSGALMYQRNAAMANPIIFPNGIPGYLYVAGGGTAPTIASAFSGNSGLTITGENSTSPITVTGHSTYTGTTYINNALVVASAASNFSDSNSIVLNANAVLVPTASNFLSGSQSLTLNPGSSLSAAGLSTSVNNLTFNAGSLATSLDYNTTLKAGGAVQLNGASLNLVLPSAPVAGTAYTLIANQGGQAIGGTFAGLSEGATVSAQFGGKTYSFQITYQGGSGHDVVLTALGQPELLAGTPKINSHVTALTQRQLNRVVSEAIADWAATGLSTVQISELRNAQFVIGALPSGMLGETVGNVITIDPTADGYGWSLGAAVSPSKVDLLTVVSHELGHELGLSDLDTQSHPGDVMDNTLGVGIRRLPSAYDILRLD